MMPMKMKRCFPLATLLTGLLISQSLQAAIGLDRTRVIFDGANKSMTLNISNNNTTLPYLAQAWIEDPAGKKITSPLVVLPPVQRIEPGKASQLKIESLPAIASLPQDRESLYYFNLREIPPKSKQPNSLQIALQTRVKLFYRPKGIQLEKRAAPWQEQVILIKQGDKLMVKNPTPYYLTLINASANSAAAKSDNKSFTPIMVAPFSELPLGVNSNTLGQRPVLTYINDYGGRPLLNFDCKASQCTVVTDGSSGTN